MRFASELQLKLGRRVDFDEAIRFLLKCRKKKNLNLLMEACIPRDSGEALNELYMERKKDERRHSDPRI